MVQEIQHPIADYLPLLIAGELNKLLDLFAGEPLVNEPHFGQIKNVDQFKKFVSTTHEWLTQRRARVENVAITQNEMRAVLECILHLVQDNRAVPLPVAIVGDVSGDKLTFVRVYHSMYPLLGKHMVRPPILPYLHEPRMPDVIKRYQNALAQGDLEAVVEQFEPSGSAREPSGGEFIYQGLEQLRQFYGMLFSNDGGIPLEHCSVTDDGIRCAIEYNVIFWGRTQLPPQTGVAVYERGASGLLLAARIYDDVDPPLAIE
jgi:hypothetical protein